MNVLPREKQVAVLAALTEGSSIRSVERMTGIHRDTVMRLGVRAGQAAQRFMAETMHDLPCKDLQLDEQWTFIRKKQRRLGAGDNPEHDGDIWVWSALDRDTRAVPTYRVGKRDARTAEEFVCDLSARLRHRVQLSADGLALYVEAIEAGFGGAVDFGQIVKSFESEPIGAGRYSPPRVKSVDRNVVSGTPNADRICTSHIERLHLSNRMRNRRMTRLVDSHSKKRENFEASVGLMYWSYNFARRHSAHKLTPAQAVGVASEPLTLHDLLDFAGAN
jgi:IS1 family transposase